VGIRLAISPHPLKIFRTAQAEPALHTEYAMLEWLCVPVNFLDVVIFANGQAVTAFGAAAFQNAAAVSRSHACPETVEAHASPVFWLVGSLRHKTRFLSNNYLGYEHPRVSVLNTPQVNGRLPVTDEP